MALSERITALLLALLLLSLGNGQKVFLHWCGEQLEDWGLSKETISCEMETQQCPFHAAETDKEPCCSDTVVSLDLDAFSLTKVHILVASLFYDAKQSLPREVRFAHEANLPCYASPIHGPPLMARSTRSHLQFRRLII